MSNIWQLFDWSMDGILGRRAQRVAKRLFASIFLLGFMSAGLATWFINSYLAYEESRFKAMISPMLQVIYHRAHLPSRAIK